MVSVPYTAELSIVRDSPIISLKIELTNNNIMWCTQFLSIEYSNVFKATGEDYKS